MPATPRPLALLVAGGLAAAPFLTATDTASAPAHAPRDAAPDLLAVAESAGGFTTLVAAIEAAGLVDTLSGDGPFTVFAPTDDAFAALPAGALESLLRPEAREDLIELLGQHVVPGRVDAAAAVVAGEAVSLAGASLAFAVERGDLTVNGVAVIDTDIDARNGVIHVIDRVLLPPPPAMTTDRAALSLIDLAVARGAPLFNAGQPAACAAVYEVAATALRDVGREALPRVATQRLDRELTGLARLRDPVDRAWALRGALDDVAAMLATREATEAAARPRGDGRPPSAARTADAHAAALAAGRRRVLMDFDDASTPAWFPVNDDVMGGISDGAYRRTARGTALFTGTLSLENNGGFATIRSPASPLDLAGWDGLVLRVRGDGRTYTLSCLANDRRNEINYFQGEFDTVADTWIEVTVPFDQLTHRVMGWTVPGSTIAPADIRSLSVGVSDKDTRPFALEIDWIAAWRD